MRSVLFPESLALVLCCLAGVASAQTFEGLATPEFRVNSFELGDQRVPLVASAADGRSVVIWQSRNQDQPGWGIHAQRLDAATDFLGDEFRINVFNDGNQDGQALAMAPDGAFVVAWNGPDRLSVDPVISLRRFDANAVPLAGDRRISESTGQTQILPRLGIDQDDRVHLSWEAVTADNFDILGNAAGADGTALDSPTTRNTITAGAQRRADLAVRPDGSQVLVWQDIAIDGNDWGVVLRCLDPAGQGPAEVQVNQATQGQQSQPRVALRPDGAFAVVWQDNSGLSSFVYRRIMARRYGPDCLPLGPEVQVNQFDEGIQDLPAITVDGLGHYVIAWQSLPDDFEQQGIRARRLAADGQFLGDEFVVHEEVEAFQDFPDLTGLPDGGFLAVWESAGQDESGFGIYARRFLGPAPAELIILEGADQTAPIGEAFALPLRIEVRDQWGQPLPGSLLRLTAPGAGASVLFSNGLSSIEGVTDGAGQLSLSLQANGLPGSYAVSIEAPATGRVLSVALSNLGPAGAAFPVPALGPAGLVLLAFALFWFLRRRALLS
ncbi:hypothetical protein [Wenzhouxiangella marina]|uniref:Uncharacterized protein n=1 Tax=Wenzhouxiangella marina TaxID=1579979 RepID=A0A0K0Y0A7_9GAMM|nr:hypothetical protein [Wenzhouxiangella marina]AKS43369.1 hypothetical protein WM2015_3017 [Wenzhouxiangella marina]MBB6088515.1 hypothetical protein [Wenzhouxiangella marina]